MECLVIFEINRSENMISYPFNGHVLDQRYMNALFKYCPIPFKISQLRFCTCACR